MKLIRSYLHYMIAVAAMILIKLFVPPVNGLTAIGVNVLAVLFPVLYLWLTVGTDWVSLIALAGIIMTGVLTPTAVYAGSIGTSTIIIVITCMALNACLTATGVTKKIAVWFLTRNIVRNRPYAFIAMFLLACMLLGLIMEAATLCLIFLALTSEICGEIGYKKGDNFYTAMALGVFWMSNVTNGATPISHAVPLIMISNASAQGIEVSYTQWMSLGIPYAVLMYIAAVLVICFIWKPECSRYANYNLDEMRRKDKETPLSRQGVITTVIFALVVAAWVLPEVCPGILPDMLVTSLKTWGNTIPPVFAVSLLCIIKVGDKPIAKFSEITKTIPMSLLIFVGCVTVLGTAVSSAEAGVSVALGNILSPVAANLTPVVIVALALGFCLVMTNFVSNVVSMLLCFSITITMIAGSGLSVIVVTVIIGFLANFASLVPSSNVTAPLFFGPEHITVKNTMKYNLIMIVVAFTVGVVVLLPLGNILGI